MFAEQWIGEAKLFFEPKLGRTANTRAQVSKRTAARAKDGWKYAGGKQQRALKAKAIAKAAILFEIGIDRHAKVGNIALRTERSERRAASDDERFSIELFEKRDRLLQRGSSAAHNGGHALESIFQSIAIKGALKARDIADKVFKRLVAMQPIEKKRVRKSCFSL